MKRIGIPSDAAYKAGKKKERASKAIQALKAVQNDIRESIFNQAKLSSTAHAINEILPELERYRKFLDL